MKKSTLLATSAIVIGLITGTANADTIRFWTTENQPERLAKQEAMALILISKQAILLKLFL